jgi:Rhodanese-like domain
VGSSPTRGTGAGQKGGPLAQLERTDPWGQVGGGGDQAGDPAGDREQAAERTDTTRSDPTTTRIDISRLEELRADGAQLVEVLPAAEYAEEHLPGAVSIPLEQLDGTTTARLDRDRPVVVYCWDSL